MVGVGAATKSVKGQQRVSVELQLYGSALSAMNPLNPKLIVFALLVACISHVAHGVDESPAAGVRSVPHPGFPQRCIRVWCTGSLPPGVNWSTWRARRPARMPHAPGRMGDAALNNPPPISRPFPLRPHAGTQRAYRRVRRHA